MAASHGPRRRPFQKKNVEKKKIQHQKMVKKMTLPLSGWQIITSVALIAIALAWILSCTHQKYVARLRTPQLHSPQSKRFQARRRAAFPPPYPNGWYHVCNSVDVAAGRVHTIAAIGLDLVAFREANSRKIGILAAHCPHLGAHLGEGGTVIGDSLRCPFHGWQFDASGQAVKIPYARRDADSPPKRCKTQSYEVREHLGTVYLWFDAEGRPPAYELRQHLDLLSDLPSGKMRLVRAAHSQFEMHVCEMHENSADPYHFQTLHGPLPIPYAAELVGCTHICSQTYPESPATPDNLMQEAIFREQMVDLRLFHKCAKDPARGGISLARWVPFLGRFLKVRVCARNVSYSTYSYFVPIMTHLSIRTLFLLRYVYAHLKTIATVVTFEGPTIISFVITTPIGTLRLLQSLLPTAPFTQHVESRWYASRWFPTPLALIFASIAAEALEQDRQVWEVSVLRTSTSTRITNCLPSFLPSFLPSLLPSFLPTQNFHFLPPYAHTPFHERTYGIPGTCV